MYIMYKLQFLQSSHFTWVNAAMLLRKKARWGHIALVSTDVCREINELTVKTVQSLSW